MTAQPAAVAPACRICGAVALRDHAGRRLAHCVNCDALERHRALAATCDDELRDGADRRVLEIAPVSPICFKEYLESRGWRHLSADKWRTGNPHDRRDVRFVDLEVDVAEMHRFADGMFDLVIAQHVIEEVPGHVKALDEIHRVLRARGIALLEIPYDARRAASIAHPPDRFGNVWTFGRDLVEELRARFARVETRELREGDYRGEVFVCQTT